jgi:hypothetical protein
MHRRSLLLALTPVALAVAALTAPMASAAAPTVTQFNTTATSVAKGLCSFDVSVTSVLNGTEKDYTDQNGNLTRIAFNFVEQDTFSANGHQLVGDPFRNLEQLLFDSSGNVTHVYEAGVIERVPLPGGSVFLSAGRLDFVAHGATFLITPDTGLSGNLDAFCGALAP